MNQPDSDQAKLWSEFARAELDVQEDDSTRSASFRPRGLIGSLLWPMLRSRLFTYADEDWPKIHWLKQACRDSGENLLDVGVRTGDLAEKFGRWGKTVYGIDIAGEYVEHCRKAKLIKDGAVCDITVDEIPVPATFDSQQPDKYDLIFIGEVIEHLLDAQDAFTRLGKVCRRGGHIIVTTPNLAYLGNRFRVPLGKDLHPLTMDRGVVGHQHIRVYTVRLLKELLANAGFRTVSVGSDGVVLDMQRWFSLKDDRQRDGANTKDQPPLAVLPLTSWPFPALGRTIYVKAIRE